jgi:ribosomal-protein-alanine N-acetyltransferase
VILHSARDGGVTGWQEFGEMSVGGLLVRIGNAADLEAVVALERGVAEAPHWSEATFAGMIGMDAQQSGAVRRCLFVAEIEGRVVGFAVGKVIGAGRDCVAELESVVVEAGGRRGGVGRALCGAVVEWCRGEGAAELELEVRAGSAGAIALYTGLGFVTMGRRAAYYRGIRGLAVSDLAGYGAPAEDALLMRLELAKGE